MLYNMSPTELHWMASDYEKPPRLIERYNLAQELVDDCMRRLMAVLLGCSKRL